jgi:AcrR family transcriptional regulator
MPVPRPNLPSVSLAEGGSLGLMVQPRFADRPRRRLLHRAERAANILEAASRVFARGGYAGTSMDEIAAEAGVSKLMLYRHFNSKRELYQAVLAEVGARLAAIEHRPASLVDIAPEQALREASATLLATIRVARAMPDGYRLFHDHAAHEPEFADHVRNIRARSEAKAASLLAPSVRDPDLLRWGARVIARFTDEAVLAWLDIGEPGRDQLIADRLAGMLSALHTRLLDTPDEC